LSGCEVHPTSSELNSLANPGDEVPLSIDDLDRLLASLKCVVRRPQDERRRRGAVSQREASIFDDERSLSVRCRVRVAELGCPDQDDIIEGAVLGRRGCTSDEPTVRTTAAIRASMTT
jgi:hypothetical protein